MKLLHQRPEQAARRLTGQTFVITGRLEVMTPMEAKEAVKYKGGYIESDLSIGTTYLVVGLEPIQEQIQTAHRFGIRLIDENQFLHLLGAS